MPSFMNPFPGLEPGKKLDPRELTRSIRLAIAAELEAVHLYEAIADSSEDSKVSKILQNIADEEKVHAGELEVVLRKLDKDQEALFGKGLEEASGLVARVIIKAQDDGVKFPGKYYMSTTYETWDEESAEIGDTDERGWDLEDVEYDSLGELLDDAEHDHSWIEWSSSRPGSHDWVISQSEDDMYSGEDTIYNLFIKKVSGPGRHGPGLTQDEIDYISERLRL